MDHFSRDKRGPYILNWVYWKIYPGMILNLDTPNLTHRVHIGRGVICESLHCTKTCDQEWQSQKEGMVTHFLSDPEVGSVPSPSLFAPPPPPMAVSRWLFHPEEARPSSASSKASSRAWNEEQGLINSLGVQYLWISILLNVNWILELDNVWFFVQLINRPRMTKNLL